MKIRLASYFCGMWIMILGLRYMSGREAIVFGAAYLGCVVTNTLLGMGIQRDISAKELP